MGKIVMKDLTFSETVLANLAKIHIWGGSLFDHGRSIVFLSNICHSFGSL